MYSSITPTLLQLSSSCVDNNELISSKGSIDGNALDPNSMASIIPAALHPLVII